MLVKNNSFFRFILSGGINTAFTYAIYLISLRFLNYKISYSIAYISGVILSFILNRFFVFATHKGIKSIILYPFVYVFQYFFGLFIVWLWVSELKLAPEIAPIVSIILTIPLTFILSRFVFVGRQ